MLPDAKLLAEDSPGAPADGGKPPMSGAGADVACPLGCRGEGDSIGLGCADDGVCRCGDCGEDCGADERGWDGKLGESLGEAMAC